MLTLFIVHELSLEVTSRCFQCEVRLIIVFDNKNASGTNHERTHECFVLNDKIMLIFCIEKFVESNEGIYTTHNSNIRIKQ